MSGVPGLGLVGVLTLGRNLCTAYAQLGARGTSILFASGDGGVAGSRDQTCSTFVPTFPSGCPLYVPRSSARAPHR